MIRKAVKEDIKNIMKIIEETIVEMHLYGNYQWDENYPQEKDFINDIQKGDLFAYEREGKLVGFVCINQVEPAEYRGLNWSFNEEFLVIHRMAVKPSVRKTGIGTELMKFADRLALENNIRYIKTDTNSVNAKMNALFKKCGYNFVGEISFLGKEKPFYCYEKIIN